MCEHWMCGARWYPRAILRAECHNSRRRGAPKLLLPMQLDVRFGEEMQRGGDCDWYLGRTAGHVVVTCP